MCQSLHNQKIRGYTLTELLVVLAVVSILAVIAHANLNEARKISRDTQRINDLEHIRLALRVHKDRFGHYPDCEGGVVIGLGEDQSKPASNGEPCLDINMNEILSHYLSGIPTDPLGPNNPDYRYIYDSDHPCGDESNPTRNVVVYATKAERSSNWNWHIPGGTYQGVCGNNGGIPDFETYGIVIE